MNEPADALDALAGETLAEVQRAGALTEYSRDGLPFAALDPTGAVEFRLGGEISEAARRTPDTLGSARGDDWVRLAPAGWDDHSRDRLEAWFRVAWKLAAQK